MEAVFCVITGLNLGQWAKLLYSKVELLIYPNASAITRLFKGTVSREKLFNWGLGVMD